MTALKYDSGYIRFQQRQSPFQFTDQFRHQILVRIQAQHPFRRYRSMFQSPIKLLRVLVLPFVLQHLYVFIFLCDPDRLIRGETIDNEYLFGKGRDILYAILRCKSV